jgi:hypothetical protein
VAQIASQHVGRGSQEIPKLTVQLLRATARGTYVGYDAAADRAQDRRRRSQLLPVIRYEHGGVIRGEYVEPGIPGVC